MAGQLVALHHTKTIADAADAFLARDMAMTTRRSYAQTMHRLATEHGVLPVAALDGATLDTFTAATWGPVWAGDLEPPRRDATFVHRVRATPRLAGRRSGRGS